MVPHDPARRLFQFFFDGSCLSINQSDHVEVRILRCSTACPGAKYDNSSNASLYLRRQTRLEVLHQCHVFAIHVMTFVYTYKFYTNLIISKSLREKTGRQAFDFCKLIRHFHM
jgi:hypothetical protein